MKNPRSRFNGILNAIVIGLCLASALPAAQAGSSLTDSEIEISEIKLALASERNENKQLRVKLAASEAVILGLQKHLGISSSESDVFRRQAADLKLRIEALGIDAAGGNISKLEQRLLTAVNDLKIAEDDRKSLREALVRLTEAVLTYQKVTVSSHPESRLALEAEMRGAAKALGIVPMDAVEANAIASTITDGMVISIKEDLALVVANLGSSQGVKLGMPFRVIRGSKTIATVRIVDVREKIAGAVIESLLSEEAKVQVGDRLTVEARQ